MSNKQKAIVTKRCINLILAQTKIGQRDIEGVTK